MNLTKVSGALSKVTGRAGLQLQKHSPEILMVAGITGIVGSTILACRATLKAEAVLDEHHEKLEKIKEVREIDFVDVEKYSDEDYKKDLVVTHVQTGVDFVKLYGPAVSLGVASIVCIIAAHDIMQKRNVALVAAYKAVEEGFSAYRKRVVEEYGEDKDYMFKNGLRAEEITDVEVGEDGKPKKVKKEVLVTDPNGLSVYAKWFDRSCAQWSSVPEYNLMFLKAQQDYMNQLLQARKHVFLNEVYDAVGVERTKAGAVVGWALRNDGEGDNFIDFGFSNNHEFMNGHENEVLLDFNVDGVVYDLI